VRSNSRMIGAAKASPPLWDHVTSPPRLPPTLSLPPMPHPVTSRTLDAANRGQPTEVGRSRSSPLRGFRRQDDSNRGLASLANRGWSRPPSSASTLGWTKPIVCPLSLLRRTRRRCRLPQRDRAPEAWCAHLCVRARPDECPSRPVWI